MPADLMVQIMETWFLGNRAALASFYGQHFQESALPRSQNIEHIPKQDVLRSLEQATRHTQKGAYSKGSHSFEILGTIAPTTVESAAPHAKRFLDTLRTR